MKHYLRLMRPEQYVKNIFVLAPLFFGGALFDVENWLNAGVAFLCFCFTASAIYIVNDYFDIAEDKNHPIKKFRPLALGTVTVKNSFVLSALLFAVAMILSMSVSLTLSSILLLYAVTNLLYSRWLKHISVLDINIIAFGFVLRLFAGAEATAIEPSIWILLITYLLALFLALAKRRTDVVLSIEGKEVRKNIAGYNLIFVDIVLGLLAAVLIVCYIFYCISPEVQHHYQSQWLYLSIIFVINGMLRYLQLAMVEQSTYSPTLVVLTDRFLQITIISYVLLMSYLLYFH